MANTGINEQLDNATREAIIARQIEEMNQRKRRSRRFQKIANVGSKIAGAAGYGGVGDVLGAASGEGSRDNKGGLASNQAGRKAGKLAQNKLGASAGGGAAIGGAVAGALRGEGVEGIAGGAYSWWATRIAFGALFTLVGFIPGTIYLNLHYILNKIGVKFFAPMFVWQKAGLAIANLIIVLSLLLVPALIGGAAYAYCQTWTGWGLSKVSWVAGTGDFCSVFKNATVSSGGGSGGGGASGGWDNIENLDIAITSAYRPGSRVARTGGLSAHGRGESVDIALRNPTLPFGSTDIRINRLVQIARSVGFVQPAGDTLNEYANPEPNATGGHIHLEFNLKADGSSYCDNGARVPDPPTDLVTLRGVVNVEITASDPRVRPCMRDALLRFLEEVARQAPAQP